MNISPKIAAIAPSATLRLNARAAEMKRQGMDVISFALGEPDFDTPTPVKRAGVEAIEKGRTKYTPSNGIPELREAICQKMKRDQGLEYHPAQVIVSTGAKQALFNAVMTLFAPGDEVIIPAPYWVTYPEQVRLAGADPVIVPTQEENGFRLTASALEGALTPRSKGLILNDPSNRAGTVYSPAELKALGEICQKAGMWVIADEVYECLVYAGRHHSLAAVVPGGQEHSVIVNGVSKSHAMTGWRLGYAVGPREVVAAMGSLQEHVTGNANSISQWAAVAALTGSQEPVQAMVQEFASRRTIMVEGLNRIPGFHCLPPAGAFYAFADVRSGLGREVRGRQLTSDVVLAELLLEEAMVAAVPGTAFGYPGFIRFSFATSVERITEGLQRIHHLLR